MALAATMAGLQVAGGLLSLYNQQQKDRNRINNLKEHAGFTEDWGDAILSTTFRKSGKEWRNLLDHSVQIMDSARIDAVKIKSKGERDASRSLVASAVSGADVSGGTPLEVALMQMEVSDNESNLLQMNAKSKVKSMVEDTKWRTDEMKTSAQFQRTQAYQKADLMRRGAAGIEAAQGPMAFASILGTGASAISSYAQIDQVYGTDPPSNEVLSTSSLSPSQRVKFEKASLNVIGRDN